MNDLERARQREDAMMRALTTIGESAAQLAHEIKNPITAVNVALRAVADQLGEDQQAVLEDLVLRLKRIEQMMKRTLSFASPIDVHESVCDARQLFEATLDPLRSEIERAGARVDTRIAPGGVRFRGDPTLLKEMLTNLLTNSIEAMPAGAHIALVAEHAADGTVLLAVEDDGPGVPASLRDSLFKPFVSTRRNGHGLGLTISRRIAEEHGGTLELAGGRPQGARFEARLPARRMVA